MDRKKISKKLVDLRGNIPRAIVSAKLEISESALAMYETGKRIPKDDIKIKIATYYNQTVQEIFF